MKSTTGIGGARILSFQRYTVPWMRALLGVCLALASGCGERVPRYDRNAFSTDPPAPGPLTGRMVVTNFGDDTLAILDPTDLRELWRTPIGFIPVELEGPHHVVADPRGEFIYVNLSETVAGSGSGPHGAHGTGDIPGYLLKLRTKDGGLESFVRVEKNPGDNILSPDGKTAYVSHYDLAGWIKAGMNKMLRGGDSKVAFVDTTTMTVRTTVPACPGAHGMALSEDGKSLYVSCAADEIAIVDTTNPTAGARRVTLPGAVESGSCGACPYAVSIAPDGLVWVGSLGLNNSSQRGRMDVFDPATGAFDEQATFRFQGGALFADFAGDKTSYLVYAPEQLQGRDSVRILRPVGRGRPPEDAGQVLMPPSVCTNAHAVHVDHAARRGYVVCEGDHRGAGTIVLLNLDTNMVMGTTNVGVFPDDIELVPTRSSQ